jgi:hypothetical protein
MAGQIKKVAIKKVEPLEKADVPTAGEEYHRKQKEKESKSYGAAAWSGNPSKKKKKRKERLALGNRLLNQARALRRRRSRMAEALNPFQKQ